MHNTRDCCRFKRDGKEKSDFCTVKKGSKKTNPMNQNFAQLTKKIEKFEKVMKKSAKKGVKRIVIPTKNRELGWLAQGK